MVDKAQSSSSIPGLWLVSLDLAVAPLVHIFPQIVNTPLNFLLVQNPIENNQPELLIELLDFLRVKVMNVEGLYETLAVYWQFFSNVGGILLRRFDLLHSDDLTNNVRKKS
jgi:hypothetical protein